MDIRLRGVLEFVAGGMVFGLFAYWIAHPASYPFDYYPAGPGGAILIAAPGGVAFVGLVEMLTGRPFVEIEAAWANLGGLKKFIYGTLFVIFGGAAAFVIVGLLVS
jgi:hypothetical protein